MSKVTARHIFVLTLEECEQLKGRIVAGADFAVCAKKHSICPSGKNGGDLGTIRHGQMITVLDDILFSGEVGKVLGPIESELGYHLIEITSRT